ncbi:MAG TPA: 2-keto-4-pentenoate hydratase [Negativicutes bacterium]|nr:2-keto-4-pentenoate hydratase [Negativicutes bacterium]
MRHSENSKKPCEQLTSRYPDITTDDAYKIQLYNIRAKIREGQRVVGKKIGLTSAAMQAMAGIDQPDFGYLLSDMEVTDGKIPITRVMYPRIEGEIAFVLKKDLIGPNVTTLDVMLATDYVVAAFEVVDSRIKDFKVRFADTVADNASSGLYVLGTKRVKIEDVDFAQVGMTVYKNGEMINSGVGASALGNPAFCVAWLANKMLEYGECLKAGEVILSGALNAALEAKANDQFLVRFSKLGEVRVHFTE